MLVEKIKNLIKSYLDSINVNLKKIIVKQDYGINNIIEITLVGDYYLTHPEEVHLQILDLINDVMPDNYYLEVGGLGAEYDLEDEEDYLTHIGKYVYIKSNIYHGNGTLINYNETNKIFEIEVKEKTRKKIVSIPLADVTIIRTAVKV